MKIDGLGLSSTLPGQVQLDKAKNDSFKNTMDKVLNEKDQKKLKDACVSLEAVLVQEMLKVMRQTIPQGGLFQQDFGQQTFQSMLDDEYANLIAKNGNLGLADTLYQQLKFNMTLAKQQQEQNQQESPQQEPQPEKLN
ncbi:MAG: rod-binding protein [Candidatus Saccharibacteria bacterium]